MVKMDDEDALDILALLLPRCETIGVAVPDDLPLVTAEHRRLACVTVARLMYRAGYDTQGMPLGRYRDGW